MNESSELSSSSSSSFFLQLLFHPPPFLLGGAGLNLVGPKDVDWLEEAAGFTEERISCWFSKLFTIPPPLLLPSTVAGFFSHCPELELEDVELPAVDEVVAEEADCCLFQGLSTGFMGLLFFGLLPLLLLPPPLLPFTAFPPNQLDMEEAMAFFLASKSLCVSADGPTLWAIRLFSAPGEEPSLRKKVLLLVLVLLPEPNPSILHVDYFRFSVKN